MCYVMDVQRALTETYDTLDQWMVWSLLELQLGKFLDCDPYGVPFEGGWKGAVAGPWKGVLVCFKGDEKYAQRSLKLVQSWVSHGVCAFCDASSSGNLIYTKFGPAAPHRMTVKSQEAS